MPCSLSRLAVVMPEQPAPMMQTWVGRVVMATILERVLVPREGSAQPVSRDRRRHVVAHEGGDGEQVEHLVEAEPRGERVGLLEAVDQPTEGVEAAADRDQRGDGRAARGEV